MVKEAIATGATVEEAHANACAQLGVDTAEAEFEILELPEKKRFGLFGGSPAKVRAFIRETPADVAAAYLRSVLGAMGLADVEIEIREVDAGAELVLTGEDIGFIIGHRGETLDSLQYLASLVANHVDDSYYRITLDVGNYREKRKETLENLGRKMAARAVKTGRNTSLEPMNPYERRIIHTAVQTVEPPRRDRPRGRRTPVEARQPPRQRRQGRVQPRRQVLPQGKPLVPSGAADPARSAPRPRRRDDAVRQDRKEINPEHPARRRASKEVLLFCRNQGWRKRAARVIIRKNGEC